MRARAGQWKPGIKEWDLWTDRMLRGKVGNARDAPPGGPCPFWNARCFSVVICHCPLSCAVGCSELSQCWAFLYPGWGFLMGSYLGGARLFLHLYKVAFSISSGAISKLFPDCSFQVLQRHLELSLANADSIQLKFLLLTVGKPRITGMASFPETGLS